MRYSRFYELIRIHNQELAELESAIARNIGRSEAIRFRERTRDGIIGAPYSDPICIQAVISSKSSDGNAVVLVKSAGHGVSSTALRVQLKELDGEWYVVDYENGPPAAAELDFYTAFAEAVRQDMRKVLQRVQEGQISQDNYSQFLDYLAGPR